MLTLEQFAKVMPARFMRRVEVSGECWLWTGGKYHFGHGAYWHEGKNTRAHRLAYELSCGCKLPAGLFVCHRCDVPSCVNPAHLFLGSADDNNRDMAAKGRQHRPVGDTHHNKKLNSLIVDSIRKELSFGVSAASLARIHGVHPNTVLAIKGGRTWRSAC